MLACNRLRIDSGPGWPVTEYRIEQGIVESRSVSSALGIPADTGWHRLNAEQISSHVMAHTAVAYWLRCRMGISPLLRACSPSLSDKDALSDCTRTSVCP
jgi:hypothetical protein